MAKLKITDIFDDLHYMNKMAKIVSPEDRLMSNSLFYSVKSHIVNNLLITHKSRGFNVIFKSIDVHDVDYKTDELINIIFEKDGKILDVHQKLTEDLHRILDKHFPNWDLSINKNTYNRGDMPNFDIEKYKNAHQNLMKYIRRRGIFRDILNKKLSKRTWTYDIVLKHMTYFYPELSFKFKSGKIGNSDKKNLKVVVDVFVGKKRKFENILFVDFCNKHFYEFSKILN